MIFQEPMTALNPVMTIGRQVAECAAAHHSSLTRRELRRRAIAALESVAIPHAAHRYGDRRHKRLPREREAEWLSIGISGIPPFPQNARKKWSAPS